ncbi:hypothetical protein GJAV_G00210080 [Gymnothorax javanicus]|nr:hypothetical protein GJAV_G00210080 [Gymnothorax javanicus]
MPVAGAKGLITTLSISRLQDRRRTPTSWRLAWGDPRDPHTTLSISCVKESETPLAIRAIGGGETREILTLR